MTLDELEQRILARILGRSAMNRVCAESEYNVNDPMLIERANARALSYETAADDVKFVFAQFRKETISDGD